MKLLRPLLVALTLVTACRADEPVLSASRITEGIQSLEKRYFSPTLRIWLDRPGDDLRAHWESRVNPPWWSAANAVEMLADVMNETKSTTYDAMLLAMHELHADSVKRWPLVAETLKQRNQWKPEDEEKLKQRLAKGSHFTQFRNEYLDDSGWWGIAWLKMAQRTGDKRYLDTARAIHAHMAANWNPAAGGGVIWCTEPGKQKPNAITNNLFLILSSRLAKQTGEAAYGEWAGKTIAWLHDKKLFDGTGVVDAPGHRGDWWSYNQGTYLGGLIAYAELTNSAALRNEAATVAESILTKAGFVDANGVIIEKLGTSGWDGALFKGILARYLRQTSDSLKLHHLHPETARKIDSILQTTAKSILNFAATKDGQFLGDWNEKPKNQDKNFNTDLSALIALVAALP